MNFSRMRAGKKIRVRELFLVRRAAEPAAGTGSIFRRKQRDGAATELHFSG